MEAVFVNKQNDAIFTFLQETKEGKYAEINETIIETPRIISSRDEYVFEEELPIFSCISSQI